MELVLELVKDGHLPSLKREDGLDLPGGLALLGLQRERAVDGAARQAGDGDGDRAEEVVRRKVVVLVYGNGHLLIVTLDVDLTREVPLWVVRVILVGLDDLLLAELDDRVGFRMGERRK